MDIDLTHSFIAGFTILGSVLMAVLAPSSLQGFLHQPLRPLSERATLLLAMTLLLLVGFVFRACFGWPAIDLFSGLAGAELLSMSAYSTWLWRCDLEIEQVTHFRLPMRYLCWLYFKDLGIATLVICIPWLVGLHLGSLFLGER